MPNGNYPLGLTQKITFNHFIHAIYISNVNKRVPVLDIMREGATFIIYVLVGVTEIP